MNPTKKRPKETRIHARFPAELGVAMRVFCASRSIKITAFMEEAVRQYLNRHQTPNQRGGIQQ